MNVLGLKKINLKNKRVLVRVDFNIPKKGDNLFKIEAVLPTLEYLIKQKSKIILISHFGRPACLAGRRDGKVVKNLRLDFVAKKLETLLKKKIKKVDMIIGEKVETIIGQMAEGEIVLLENIRFLATEKKNSAKLAKELAKLGDVFVNEAFSVSHRAHASIVGIPKYLPSVAGFLFQREKEELDKIFDKSRQPLVAIIGGAKVITKIMVIEKFIKKADKVLLGGAIPNTIFAAQGIELGKSLVEKEMFKIVNKLDLENPKIQLPSDFVCRNGEIVIRGINAIKEDESALDLGPETVKSFLAILTGAKTIIWNGPLGLIEEKPFDKASEIVAKSIAKSKSYSVVGGGEITAFIRKINLAKKINYLSTSGGAMLDYLVNETLPGIEALKKCKHNGK